MGNALAADVKGAGYGEYVFRIAGCAGCHTDVENDGPFLAGGRAFKSDFGTFYTPNITPHPEHGIGRWSEADFIRAMTEGTAPDGGHYFPAFPYISYTLMHTDDLRALWGYLVTAPIVAKVNRAHQLPWYMPPKISAWVWKILYFQRGPFRERTDRSAQWNRGAYLAGAVGHCGECHTPRDLLGARVQHLPYAGTIKGLGDRSVPNISSHQTTGIGRWTRDDLEYFLETGALPGGDFSGGIMAEIIENGLQYLTGPDRQALVAYLLSLKPIKNEVSTRKGEVTRRLNEFE